MKHGTNLSWVSFRQHLQSNAGALITKQFEDTPYEVTLPRVPWLRQQCYINVQSIQPVKFTELVRKAPGKFDARVISDVEIALKGWLKL